jgi:hypothetical protein
MSKIGARIMSGQMGIYNWAWLGFDFILFGDLMVIPNCMVGRLHSNKEFWVRNPSKPKSALHIVT